VFEGGGEGVGVESGFEYGWSGYESPGVLKSYEGYWL